MREYQHFKRSQKKSMKEMKNKKSQIYDSVINLAFIIRSVLFIAVIVVQLLRHVRLLVIPCIAGFQAPLSSTISQSLLKFTSTESMILSNYLIPSCSLLLLPSILPSIKVFSNEVALHIRWPKYWNCSFSISTFKEYSGLFPLGSTGLIPLQLVQGTLKSLLQCYNSEASILQLSDFLMIQLLHLQMTTGKNHTFDTWTFIGKMIFLLFNTLYLFIKTVLPRSKRLLISWLQSSSTVILDSLKIKSVTVSSFPLSVCLEVMGPDAMV